MSAAKKNVPHLDKDSVKHPPFKTGGELKTETFRFRGKFDQFVVTIETLTPPTGQNLTDSTVATAKIAAASAKQEVAISPPYPVAGVRCGRDNSISRMSKARHTYYTVYSATANTTTSAANTTATPNSTTGAASAAVTTTATTGTSSTSFYLVRS